MTRIITNPDNTLSVEWQGRKGGGSLLQLAAEGNVPRVNRLNLVELYAIILAIKADPSPLGRGERTYRWALAELSNPDNVAKYWKSGFPTDDLGKLRQAVVQRAGEGFNAPTDSYLHIASDIASGVTPVHRY